MSPKGGRFGSLTENQISSQITNLDNSTRLVVPISIFISDSIPDLITV